jgi:RNA polymerase sigma-70 factor, ECF subfamily
VADEPDAAETAIRAAVEARDFEHAATLTVERYGAELFAFLLSQTRDADAAGELFQHWSEQFWRSLGSYEGRCSVRTWAYKLARRAIHHHRRLEHKHAGARLTELSRLSIAVDRVRTATAIYKRTEVKDRFRELREQMPEEDQTLLILRIDRGLSWLELAEIMLGEENSPGQGQLKTEAARLRKRFQIAKEKLRKMVEDAGLLE